MLLAVSLKLRVTCSSWQVRPTLARLALKAGLSSRSVEGLSQLRDRDEARFQKVPKQGWDASRICPAPQPFSSCKLFLPSALVLYPFLPQTVEQVSNLSTLWPPPALPQSPRFITSHDPGNASLMAQEASQREVARDVECAPHRGQHSCT